jgi:hypothetical protein
MAKRKRICVPIIPIVVLLIALLISFSFYQGIKRIDKEQQLLGLPTLLNNSTLTPTSSPTPTISPTPYLLPGLDNKWYKIHADYYKNWNDCIYIIVTADQSSKSIEDYIGIWPISKDLTKRFQIPGYESRVEPQQGIGHLMTIYLKKGSHIFTLNISAVVTYDELTEESKKRCGNYPTYGDIDKFLEFFPKLYPSN